MPGIRVSTLGLRLEPHEATDGWHYPTFVDQLYEQGLIGGCFFRLNLGQYHGEVLFDGIGYTKLNKSTLAVKPQKCERVTGNRELWDINPDQVNFKILFNVWKVHSESSYLLPIPEWFFTRGTSTTVNSTSKRKRIVVSNSPSTTARRGSASRSLSFLGWRQTTNMSLSVLTEFEDPSVMPAFDYLGRSTFILGHSFLKYAYVAIDQDKKEMWFAQAVHPTIEGQ
ncbi:hypothetical protein SAICODRAFT_26782 [Saitoella complicata NRRL Y-17804]|uniref:uncharacterized protein n=1 Tax=Saitoella complicata (strain BCRC 22490 / CBS 7301 / JCM 7358 / NBRC 10748 / NRRL Y-17804) TaxID=698492 RepID=UPI00086752AA|nr:uncharacterized protein SAICODRAFT_26782 [Saitoella complicata NRRL Y-17804]ODQ51350.1 hypothetical protein SAICODRAFT_26782 [Saitoella complicata NRRL Y-17804]